MIEEVCHTSKKDFAGQYAALRQKEGRMYSDEELEHLPFIAASHPFFKEWQLREQSSRRLVRYLQRNKKELNILEIGCGNGWLCHRLAGLKHSTVTGIDIHFEEIQQAARVFANIENLHFMYGDIRSGFFKEKQFDCIVFAASIQYFPSLPEIVTIISALLKEDGEVHILDTHFYRAGEAAVAKYRSQQYFSIMGLPAMSDWYHHHSFQELGPFEYKILYKPSPLPFFKRQNPFPWIAIKNKKSS